MLAPTRENGIYKEGYLTKSPFHSDNNPVYGTKVRSFLQIAKFLLNGLSSNFAHFQGAITLNIDN